MKKESFEFYKCLSPKRKNPLIVLALSDSVGMIVSVGDSLWEKSDVGYVFEPAVPFSETRCWEKVNGKISFTLGK